jgi:uncharacterized repeat protein (TIGR01451 family)
VRALGRAFVIAAAAMLVTPVPPASASTQHADLMVTMTASPQPAYLGWVLTYHVVVTNNGPATATDAALQFPLGSDAGAAYEDSSYTSQGRCEYRAGTWYCVLGNIAPRGNVYMTFFVWQNGGDGAFGGVTVQSSTPDPNPRNNSYVTTTGIILKDTPQPRPSGAPSETPSTRPSGSQTSSGTPTSTVTGTASPTSTTRPLPSSGGAGTGLRVALGACLFLGAGAAGVAIRRRRDRSAGS